MAANPQKLLTFRLPSTNRLIAWAEFGAPTGRPLVFLHGTPSCRLECAAFHEKLYERKIRLIAPDRPGMGRSEFHPDRAIGGYADDIRALAEHLRLNRFAVMGGSGGGPYALACARHITPEQGLRAAAVLAGMGPRHAGLQDVNWTTKLNLYLSKWSPGLLRWISKHYLPVPKTVPTGPVEEIQVDPTAEAKMAKTLDAYIKTVNSEANKKALDKPKAREMIAAITIEALIQGLDGYMFEVGSYWKDWGFKLEDITFASESGRPLVLWYGTEDTSTTIHMGRYIAARVPGAELREEEGKTHFTIGIKAVDYMDELLKLGEIQE